MDPSTTPQSDPLNPNSDPATADAPETWSKWLAGNAAPVLSSLIVGVCVVAFLNVWDVMKVALGLGLVIFIHELGHFLAAKWCDVHVSTFSIGFGKPIPGCKFTYGETLYKIGWIPLGGFVQMVGEGDNADSDEAEEDPRSFKNKPVVQRMLIISAGVMMNILLASVCFIMAYLHGIEEKPPIIGWVEPGSPAWQDGIESGMMFDSVDDIHNPVFDDIRVRVISSSKGETVRFVTRELPGSPSQEFRVEPIRYPDALWPTVGVGYSYQLTLEKSRRAEAKPFRGGSKAAEASPAFQQGDRIIACSNDPNDPSSIAAIPVDPRASTDRRLDYFEFLSRQQTMRGLPMIVRVERADTQEKVDITIAPAATYTTGMRMRMGRVAAVRKGFPAATATVVGGGDGGIQPRKGEESDTGDKLIEVEVMDVDEKGDPFALLWSADDAGADGAAGAADVAQAKQKGMVAKPLDPLRLPFELEQWAERQKKRTKGRQNWEVKLTVLRPTDRKEERSKEKRVQLTTEWRHEARLLREIQASANSPLSIPCLGLAYFVDAVVDDVEPGSPAAEAGLEKGDVIKEVKSIYTNVAKNKDEEGKWQPIKVHQWANVFSYLQDTDPKLLELNLKVERASGQMEFKFRAKEDPNWPTADRGLSFQADARLHKADTVLEALEMGTHRTIRTIKSIYLNLYSMVFGRVSAFTMSGPLTIADVSYKIAGENIWQFILFIGMINVNLAVVNFLPIPVLDGGHMVFLIYEKVRGKPAPESIFIGAMWVGLAMILSLMVFVIFLDVRRLFF